MAYNKKWTASEILNLKFHGAKNPFSPNILKKGKINPDVAFELSQGKSFLRDDGDIFGVTIVAVNRKQWKARGLHDLSNAFGTKNEAEAHINKLKRIMKKNRGRL